MKNELIVMRAGGLVKITHSTPDFVGHYQFLMDAESASRLADALKTLVHNPDVDLLKVEYANPR